MPDLIIPIKIDVAGFIAEMKEFAANVDSLIREAEELARLVHGEFCPNTRGRADWRTCPDCGRVAKLITDLRPVVDKAIALDRTRPNRDDA